MVLSATFSWARSFQEGHWNDDAREVWKRRVLKGVLGV